MPFPLFSCIGYYHTIFLFLLLPCLHCSRLRLPLLFPAAMEPSKLNTDTTGWNRECYTYFILSFEIGGHLFHVCHSCLQSPKCSSHFVCLKEFSLGAQSLEAFRMFAEVSQSLNRNSKGRLSNKEAGKNTCDRSASNRSNRNSWSLDPCWRQWSRIAVTWQVLRWTFSNDTLSSRASPSARSWPCTLLNMLYPSLLAIW